MAKKTKMIPVSSHDSEAVWQHPKPRQIRRDPTREERRWVMHYDLIYDGGGSRFQQFYRTRFGARWSAFWHLHFRSWGGNAYLYENGREA